MRVSRRKFIRSAVIGAAGASFIQSSGKNASAAAKDSGEVMLDALLISYVSPPLGTQGSSLWTPLTRYTTTLSLRSPANPDLSLRAGISLDQERTNGLVAQSESGKIENALTLFARPNRDVSFSTGTPSPGLPENVVFFGLHHPILSFRGNSRKAQFRIVDAEASFASTANGIRDFVSEDTARSILAQYIFDRTLLIEPRFVFVQTSDNDRLSISQRADRRAPQDITATVSAEIIEQRGFESDVLRQAFPVGGNLEVTYYSATETKGEILEFDSSLERTSTGLNSVFWDRVFKTFVIIDGAG